MREVEGPVGILDDGWGDGGERAFEGRDEVRFGRDEAECVCGVGDAEVCFPAQLAMNLEDGERGRTVHLIVHYDACFGNH